MNDFDVAFNYLIIKDESSKYVNDPRDSGGSTRWGITKKTYADFYHRKLEDVPDSEIEGMPAAVAKQIYSALYWSRLSCENISDPSFSCAIFDICVLFGVHVILRVVQAALFSCGVAVKSEEVFGDNSAVLLNEFVGGEKQNRPALMHAIQTRLYDHVDGIEASHPKDEVFRLGWTRRIERLSLLLDVNYFNQFRQEIFK